MYMCILCTGKKRGGGKGGISKDVNTRQEKSGRGHRRVQATAGQACCLERRKACSDV